MQSRGCRWVGRGHSASGLRGGSNSATGWGDLTSSREREPWLASARLWWGRLLKELFGQCSSQAVRMEMDEGLEGGRLMWRIIVCTAGKEGEGAVTILQAQLLLRSELSALMSAPKCPVLLNDAVTARPAARRGASMLGSRRLTSSSAEHRASPLVLIPSLVKSQLTFHRSALSPPLLCFARGLSLWVRLFATPALKHTRIPCPSLAPGVCSNSCPLSQWHHPIFSSSIASFSSCPQSFPASGSFPMSQFGASASASVLPLNIQGWFPLGLTGLISSLTKGLSRVFSNTAVWKHQFFSTQPSWWSNSHICQLVTTGKTTALPIQTFVCKMMSLLFNTLSRFVIAFLPRSKHFCHVTFIGWVSGFIFVSWTLPFFVVVCLHHLCGIPHPNKTDSQAEQTWFLIPRERRTKQNRKKII